MCFFLLCILHSMPISAEQNKHEKDRATQDAITIEKHRKFDFLRKNQELLIGKILQ